MSYQSPPVSTISRKALLTSQTNANQGGMGKNKRKRRGMYGSPIELLPILWQSRRTCLVQKGPWSALVAFRDACTYVDGRI